MYDEKLMRPGAMFDDSEETPESLNHKSSDIINKFLGEELRAVEMFGVEWYYGPLLAWTLKCIITSQGWKIVSIYGHSYIKPAYQDVQTDYTKFESCVIDGQILVEKDDIRLVITVKTCRGGTNFVQIEAAEKHQGLVKTLINAIPDFLEKNNFYRDKKLNFDNGIFFLNAGQRDWDSVILDPAMKKEIRLNTIGFLQNCARLEKYGIPPKRGIILAGEPGTGKTIVCKALMSEADKITCIAATAYGMLSDRYIPDLFSIAQDLSPSLVFIEDMDFIGQERQDFYRGNTPLISLLAEMDGIGERTAIVTVATTNNLGMLDKALSERPSRFDRVFRITRPNYEQRAELVKHISEKIPLSDNVREYVVKETNGFTPAQIQEVLHGMVISHSAMGEDVMQFNLSDVDSTIALLNIRKNCTIGFNAMLRSDCKQ
jgi:cell division protease FtsH